VGFVTNGCRQACHNDLCKLVVEHKLIENKVYSNFKLSM